MIALALGQVKDPPEGEARNGLEVRDLAGLLPRGLTGLQITFGVPICLPLEDRESVSVQ